MKRVLSALGLLAAGAALGMLFAPATGRRSRALVRDKLVHAGHRVSDYTTGKAHHLGNMAKGYYHVAAKAMHITREAAEEGAKEAAEEAKRVA